MDSLIHIKEKRDWSLKGRACANGRPQQETTKPEDASYPTATSDVVMLTCIIDVNEHRDVATIDIPNAFIQTDLNLYNKDGKWKKL